MSSSKPWHYTAIAGAVILLSTTASAQNISQLDSIVVTPSRVAQLESEVVGDISVVSNEEIQKSGQSSIAEVLVKQPGIQISNNGGPQSTTGIYLRGTNPNQTLVLVDGVRINSATQGTTNWSTINPALVDRIEIVRGGASALYGADAVGGVINIITKKADINKPFSAWGNIGYGTYGTFKSDAGISGNHNGWDYIVGAFKQDSDGFNSTNGDIGYRNYDKDGYESHGFNAGIGYTFAPGHRLSATAYNSYMDGEYDSAVETIANTRIRQQVYSLKSDNKFNDFWRSQLRFDFSKESIHDTSTGGIMPWDNWDTKYSSKQRNFNWQNDFHLNENHIISLILERREDRIKHSNSYDKRNRNTNSVGLSYLGDFNGFRTQASLRNDNYTDYGSKRTGSLGFDFDVTENITLGAVGSTSFRMPTMTDLYSSFNPEWSFEGNPNLKPESSKNIEISAKYRDDNLGLSVTAYRNSTKDLIDGFACKNWNDVWNFCELSTPLNIDKALFKGVTIAGDYQFGNTNISASADFLNAKDRNTGDYLHRRAKQTYNIGINHQIHNWNLGAEFKFVSKRYDTGFDPITFEERRVTLGGYGLTNLTAQYDFNKNISAQVRWNNVFDKKYHHAYGYNTQGSNVFVNLSFRM